ncbi:RasGEF domain-containing protein [Candidatus Berkiella aquae]|uniref:Ankyrin repeat domain-containing protein n=1 Tax=Candidatus Berkiella aquae TaxID=295108 RepID=A0A0Q9YDR7_9GAMM|nr:RasGEF domain-containing protein [Candidatus Berkiella aquae]MCS5709940.1 ankyrin repeat domain-containing protein [Candidatus Berkiella aquae]
MKYGPTNEQSVAALHAIFDSAEDEKNKVKKILELLKTNPSLINHRYLRNRSILQIAMIRQLPLLVRKLIEKHKPIITFVDNAGNGAYHYAILHYHEEILATLIELAPEFRDEKNTKGRTPLYLATERKMIPAIRLLVKANANIHEKDNEGICARMLAKDNPSLLIELKAFSIDLSKVKKVFPTLSSRQINEDALSQLASKFTALRLGSAKDTPSSDGKPSPNKTSTPPETERALNTPPSVNPSHSRIAGRLAPETVSLTTSAMTRNLTLDSFRTGDIETLKSYLESGGDPNAAIFLGRPLIIQAFHVASSIAEEFKSRELIAAQTEMFQMLAKVAKLDAQDRKGDSIVQHLQDNTLAKVMLLKSTFRALNSEMIILLKQANFRLAELELLFEQTLYDAGLTQETFATPSNNKMPSDRELLRLKHQKYMTDEYGKICWDLCSGFRPVELPIDGTQTIRPNLNKAFDKHHVCNMVQGLLAKYDRTDILMIIRRFWKHLDTHQQLRANLIIKELLISDIYQMTQDGNFKTYLTFHEERNKRAFDHPQSSIQEKAQKLNHGTLLNCYLKEMHQIRCHLAANSLLKNYDILLAWLTRNECHCNSPDFNVVVRHAIGLNDRQQKDQVAFIANEFRTMTLTCLQKVRLSEFYDKAWSDLKNPHRAPNIKECIKITNTLSWYLQELLLNEDNTTNRIKIITLFVKVAANLCHPQQGIGPDLLCIMGITSALNSSAISRLKNCFDALDKKTRAKLAELNELVDGARNFYWLRSIESASATPLPHVGNMLTKITFMYDGNKENPYAMCELLGIEFRNFQQLQTAILMHACLPETNLYTALVHGSFLEDDVRYYLSCSRFGVKATLDKTSISLVLERVNESLEKQTLPRIEYQSVEYEALEAIDVYFKYLRNELCHKPVTTEHHQLLLQAKDNLGELIRIAHAHYGYNLCDFEKCHPSLLHLETKIILDNAAVPNVLSEIRNCLQLESLPRVLFGGVDYEPIDVVKGFTHYLKNALNGKPATTEHNQWLLQSRKLLGDIIQVAKLHYQISINYPYYYGLLPKLTVLVNQTSTPGNARASLVNQTSMLGTARASVSLAAPISSGSEILSVSDFLAEPPPATLPIPSSIPPALSLATWSHHKRPTGLTNSDKSTKRKSGLDI